jgi:hypothetical protein
LRLLDCHKKVDEEPVLMPDGHVIGTGRKGGDLRRAADRSQAGDTRAWAGECPDVERDLRPAACRDGTRWWQGSGVAIRARDDERVIRDGKKSFLGT